MKAELCLRELAFVTVLVFALSQIKYYLFLFSQVNPIKITDLFFMGGLKKYLQTT